MRKKYVAFAISKRKMLSLSHVVTKHAKSVFRYIHRIGNDRYDYNIQYSERCPFCNSEIKEIKKL
jgi:hypothetical protein